MHDGARLAGAGAGQDDARAIATEHHGALLIVETNGEIARF
jgi:hypothetical protein